MKVNMTEWATTTAQFMMALSELTKGCEFLSKECAYVAGACEAFLTALAEGDLRAYVREGIMTSSYAECMALSKDIFGGVAESIREATEQYIGELVVQELLGEETNLCNVRAHLHLGMEDALLDVLARKEAK